MLWYLWYAAAYNANNLFWLENLMTTLSGVWCGNTISTKSESNWKWILCKSASVFWLRFFVTATHSFTQVFSHNQLDKINVTIDKVCRKEWTIVWNDGLHKQLSVTKAGSGFWYSVTLQERATQKKQYLTSPRKCQLCCWYWAAIIKGTAKSIVH